MWKVYKIETGKTVKAGFADEEDAKEWLETRKGLLQQDFEIEEMDPDEEEEYLNENEDDEEEEYDGSMLAEDLREIRESFIESTPAAEYVFSRTLPTTGNGPTAAPLSSIHIDGIAHDITLPISLQDMALVKEQAVKAPFGKGANTCLLYTSDAADE